MWYIVLSSTPHMGYHSQGRTPTIRKIAMLITMPTNRKRSSYTSAHCLLVLRSLRKIQSIKHWMEQCFTYREKRQGKISFSGGCRSPKASGSLQATHAEQFTYTSWAPVEEPVPSLWRTGIVTGLGGCNKMQCLSRTEERTLSLQ